MRARAAALAAALLAVLLACQPGFPGPRRVEGGRGIEGRYSYAFSDVTARAGVPTDLVRSWGSAWADFDGDGDADLFENLHHRLPRFWLNSDGALALHPDNTAFDNPDRHGCAWGEADGDGRPDLYCTVGAVQGRGRGPNQLFVQTDAGLDDVAARLGVSDALGRGRTVNWIDYDGDGDLDIFVGNEHRVGHPNVMYRNVGGAFERALVGLDDNLYTMSSSWADWDADGDPDLLILQHPRKKGGWPAVAYENDAGTFRPVSLELVSGAKWRSGAWGDYDADGDSDLHLVNGRHSLVLENARGGFRAADDRRLVEGRMSAWFDVENDGDLDAFVVQGASGTAESPGLNHPDFVLLNGGGGGFEKVTRRPWRGPRDGNGDAVSVADYDGDGRTDVFVSNGYEHAPWSGRPVLLRNISRSGNWIRVRLVGDPWNPWGLGSVVRVATDARVYRREVTDGFSYRTQSDVSALLFGIGPSRRARVIVTWPDGTRDCIDVAAAETSEVRKGTSTC